MDLTKLRQKEDEAIRAIENLSESSKWAALEILFRDLKLRPLTQVDPARAKIEAFKREEKHL